MKEQGKIVEEDHRVKKKGTERNKDKTV
jgi:hypothetical protein